MQPKDKQQHGKQTDVVLLLTGINISNGCVVAVQHGEQTDNATVGGDNPAENCE